MKHRAVTFSAVLLTLASSLGAAPALEIVELKQAPAWYATEVIEGDGKRVLSLRTDNNRAAGEFVPAKP